MARTEQLSLHRLTRTAWIDKHHLVLESRHWLKLCTHVNAPRRWNILRAQAWTSNLTSLMSRSQMFLTDLPSLMCLITADNASSGLKTPKKPSQPSSRNLSRSVILNTWTARTTSILCIRDKPVISCKTPDITKRSGSAVLCQKIRNKFEHHCNLQSRLPSCQALQTFLPTCTEGRQMIEKPRPCPQACRLLIQSRLTSRSASSPEDRLLYDRASG